MKPRCSNQRNRATTLTEVVIVAVVLAVLAVLLLPILTKSNRRVSRIGCVSNLKQIGLAYRIWEGDNGDIFPMGISVTNGGTMELAQIGDVVATFQTMSNELSTPRILICRGDGIDHGDASRTPAIDFGRLSKSNISYFVGVDVTNEANPSLILSGDSNLKIGGMAVKPGSLSVWTNDRVAWDSTRHASYGYDGNIGLSDGSVQSATASLLKILLVQTGRPTSHLAIP